MIQRLLEALTDRLPCRFIEGEGGEPYLERYYLLGVLGWHVYLHRFVDSDPDRGLHDHPWGRALSLVLVAGYDEIRSEPGAEGRTIRRFVRPWRVNWLRGDTFHRVVLRAGHPAGPCPAWTADQGLGLRTERGLSVHGPGWGGVPASGLVEACPPGVRPCAPGADTPLPKAPGSPGSPKAPSLESGRGRRGPLWWLLRRGPCAVAGWLVPWVLPSCWPAAEAAPRSSRERRAARELCLQGGHGVLLPRLGQVLLRLSDRPLPPHRVRSLRGPHPVRHARGVRELLRRPTLIPRLTVQVTVDASGAGQSLVQPLGHRVQQGPILALEEMVRTRYLYLVVALVPPTERRLTRAGAVPTTASRSFWP